MHNNARSALADHFHFYIIYFLPFFHKECQYSKQQHEFSKEPTNEESLLAT